MNTILSLIFANWLLINSNPIEPPSNLSNFYIAGDGTNIVMVYTCKNNLDLFYVKTPSETVYGLEKKF
jgi:hypothetical protein